MGKYIDVKKNALTKKLKVYINLLNLSINKQSLIILTKVRIYDFQPTFLFFKEGLDKLIN